MEAETTETTERIVENKRVVTFALRRSKSDPNISADQKMMRKDELINEAGQFTNYFLSQ